MKKRVKRVFKFILSFIVAFLLVTIAWVGAYRFINPPITPLMLIRVFQGNGLQKEWKSYEEISDNMKLAVIAAEDQRFTQHNGFDIEAIQKAITENKRGNRLRGASTISQQVAKNVFLYPTRSWVRKGFEAYFTFLIETMWDKKRIIEVYLNVVETGSGIYGVQKAAEVYFGKPAKNLSMSESALIAATLPNPQVRNPAQPTGYLYKRRSWIIRQVGHLGRARVLGQME